MYTDMHTQETLRTHARDTAYTYIRMYVCVYTQYTRDTHTHLYTNTHTYTHTYIHIRIYIRV
jgi:hypothetical protein